MGFACSKTNKKDNPVNEIIKDSKPIIMGDGNKNIQGIHNSNHLKEIKNELKEYKTHDPPQNSNPEGTRDFLEKFRSECLNAHNEKRRKHYSSDLVYNNDLNEMAQKYAESIANREQMQHSSNTFKGEHKGENLFMAGGQVVNGRSPVECWYQEIKDYDFKNPKNKKGVVGHFTQLVWKDSQQLGVGFAKSRTGDCYVVANYFPAGNYMGEEMNNVFPL